MGEAIMKVVLLHYHLKTGGVTTVIQRQVQALQGRCDTLVLTGDRAEAQLPCPVVEIPEIGYDRPDKPILTADAIVDRILQSILEVWPDGCDVLHIHNPTLAKNRHLIQCIELLQTSVSSLLLQIHDFAEDGRPQVYSREAYPRDCHYAVINSRDVQILLSAGLAPNGVHLIPNAVASLPMDTDIKLDSCVVYPVRAIRRKNIGEAILLSMFLSADKTLHISQPPTSARDLPAYYDWQSFVKKRGLNVQFGAGRQYGFPALVAAADSMVTTSITEGFGFSFLEPWTAAKKVWGRRLGDICEDFEERGLGLDWLYDELAVPLRWFDVNGFIKAWREAAQQVTATYGYERSPESLDAYIADVKKDGMIDFGILSEIFQKQVLEHLLADSKAKDWLAKQNPKIREPDPTDVDTTTIEKNRQIVQKDYNQDAYGERLSNIYAQVLQEPVQHQIDKTALLACFLGLDRFSLLKWGHYAT
jgi:glycosyltransferase involved in cell wall biosynthesis